MNLRQFYSVCNTHMGVTGMRTLIQRQGVDWFFDQIVVGETANRLSSWANSFFIHWRHSLVVGGCFPFFLSVCLSLLPMIDVTSLHEPEECGLVVPCYVVIILWGQGQSWLLLPSRLFFFDDAVVSSAMCLGWRTRYLFVIDTDWLRIVQNISSFT